MVGLITAFGAGGGTSSYREVEGADVIILWGSNAREAHPIFFHHVLAAKRRGARLIVIDPRRTATARFADTWLGLEVGTDIALAHAIAREIIVNDLHHRDFIERATTGFEEFRRCVEPWTLERAEAVTGVPAGTIREVAHTYATAERAQLGWTLGITEHITGVDNVLALINLSLLTGHVGRWGSGLQPLRGLFIVGENPAQSEPDSARVIHTLGSLEHLVVQDLYLTRTAALADVVLPAAAAWSEAEGTVTNSERRVQRVRRALDPPGEARDDLTIITMLARALGHDWPEPEASAVWD